jgi:hypothetical protein
LIVEYPRSDLLNAGLPSSRVESLMSSQLSALEKWDLVEPYFLAARNTGYLHAVDLSTERLCGLRLARETCEEIDRRLRELRREGYYRVVLQEVAGISQCQVNSLDSDPFCETQDPELLRQDLAIAPLACGKHAAAESASGIEVGSLADYRRVIEWCFATYGPRAVAVKCFWAYLRPLAVDVVDPPPQREFERLRRGDADARERRRVEDYLFAECLGLASEFSLPVKIHLGHLDGVDHPHFPHVYDHVRDVTAIVQAHPENIFVLMHTAWPQQEQLLALAKHQPNVTLDLCWAWILAPLATREFLQRALTTIPASKLLCFGGDHIAVEAVVGHSEIARRGLAAALEGLVAEEWLTTSDALELVPRLMSENANRIFPDFPGV